MATRRTTAVPVGVAALAALLLGLLTFGVQATVRPDGLPLAVAAGDGVPPPVVAEVATRGGDEVAWRVLEPGAARGELADAAVYGVLELAPAPGGGVAPTVVLSGAVNPAGTQAAQAALTGAAQALAAATAPPGAAPAPVAVVTDDAASAAGRTAPLAASALLWIGTLAASALLVVLTTGRARPGTRVAVALGAATAAVLAVLGLLALWDAGMGLGWDVAGFLLLVAVAFASVQAAVLRVLGLPGMAVLAPLYLMAPSVAGQVPELLHPVYRAALWSWSPFRFSTEGLRGLLQLDRVPPATSTALVVFGLLAVTGLVVAGWPARRAVEPAPEPRDPALVSA